MTEQNLETTYYGFTLKQYRESIRKLAEDRGLKGDTLEWVVEKAVGLIPTIRVGSTA